jgi:cob(I)alamin adenosyltransferase
MLSAAPRHATTLAQTLLLLRSLQYLSAPELLLSAARAPATPTNAARLPSRPADAAPRRPLSSSSSSTPTPRFSTMAGEEGAGAAAAEGAATAAAGGGGSKFKIYTRTGDKGESSLYTGDRLAKDAAFFAALGDVDELNSAIGMAAALLADTSLVVKEPSNISDGPPPLAQQLAELQSRLLDTGSAIATPATSGKAGAATKQARAAFAEAAACTARLEGWIDAMDAELPPLRNFILPSGGPAASALHVARSVCRRAERACVPLWRDGALDADVLAFLNRLSDYLFTASRFVAIREGHAETVYKKGKEGV